MKEVLKESEVVSMGRTLNYNGKPMTLHVSNFRSHPLCMSITGSTEGIFGMKKDVILVASVGDNTGHGKTMQMYQGYLDASNRNYPEIKKMFEDSGLATPVVDSNGQLSQKKMGSYTFTLYNFDREKLRSCDLRGCQAYENNYNKALLISHTRDVVNQRMEQAMGPDNMY